MSNIARMMQRATAGAAGAGLDVDALLSTNVYRGTGSAQTITNNIDLSGEGGLVWVKSRTESQFSGSQYDGYNILVDTERGVNNVINSDRQNLQNWTSFGNTVTTFNSNGFALGTSDYVNYSGHDFVAWTFRKAKKFFDVVTWTGNGSSGRQISHNLGTTVGSIFVKSTNNNRKWSVFHRSMDTSNPSHYKMHLDQNEARSDEEHIWNDTEPTSTVFTVGNDGEVNASGETYVAYLFAHNNGDGEFGPNGDQDIIKCGTFDGSDAGGNAINLGFEPALVIYKQYNGTGGAWFINDEMRGLSSRPPKTGRAKPIYLNDDEDESGLQYSIGIGAEGFFENGLGNGNKFIYIAIRKGPLTEPTSASNVFAVDQGINQTTNDTQVFDAGFPVDMFIRTDPTTSYNRLVLSRLTEHSTYLRTNSSDSGGTTAYGNKFDSNTGIVSETAFNWTSHYAYMWRRAPGFFDVVCHEGDGTADRAIAHNLGVVPKLRITKSRENTLYSSWWVYYIDGSGTQTRATFTQSPFYANTDVVSTATNIYPDVSVTNASGIDYVHYLFGEVSGVSKISTYTGNGSTSDINVDCGFSNGCKFLLIKSKTESTEWLVWDSVRGIVSGNDPWFRLDVNGSQTTDTDYIDPLSSGFTVTTNAPTSGLYSLNANNVEYVFYAIAA